MRLSSVRTPWGHSWSSGPLKVDSERKLERERERDLFFRLSRKSSVSLERHAVLWTHLKEM